MKEILPGIFHWTSFHEEIDQDVHSYFVTATGANILIDPRMPSEGTTWFGQDRRPEHIYLTNRLHYRHSAQFLEAYATKIWCHSAGLHEFSQHPKVHGFEHGQELPGKVVALEIGSLCPEETAFFIPANAGILALGDAVIREGAALQFVPDMLMGDNPEGVKRGLRAALRRHLEERDFQHLLLAHGEPIVGKAKATLQEFVGTA